MKTDAMDRPERLEYRSMIAHALDQRRLGRPISAVGLTRVPASNADNRLSMFRVALTISSKATAVSGGSLLPDLLNRSLCVFQLITRHPNILSFDRSKPVRTQFRCSPVEPSRAACWSQL
jgi:hypothetical protein